MSDRERDSGIGAEPRRDSDEEEERLEQVQEEDEPEVEHQATPPEEDEPTNEEEEEVEVVLHPPQALGDVDQEPDAQDIDPLPQAPPIDIDAVPPIDIDAAPHLAPAVTFSDEEEEFEEFLANLDPEILAYRMAVQGGQLNTLVSYSGEEGIEVEAWIQAVETAKSTFEWTNAQTAGAAKSKLTGAAQLWLLCETEDGTAFDQWPDLKTAIKSRFTMAINEQIASNAIAELKQKEDESVASFYDRCRRAVQKKNYSVTDATKQTDPYKNQVKVDVLLFFLAGLKPTIKHRFPQPHPTTLDDAVKAAKAIESENVHRRPILKGAVTAAPKGSAICSLEPADPYASSCSVVWEMGEAMDAMKAELAELKLNAKANVTCYNCGGKGHMSPDCPSAKGAAGKGRGQPGFRGKGGRGKGKGKSSGKGQQGKKGKGPVNEVGEGRPWNEQGNE